jgi:hypothetical protein
MTKQVQRRRGTATQHTSFTGAEGELSVNTTNKSVHVHDNVTAGGFEAARADMDNVTSSSILTAAGITATTAELNYVDGVTSNIQTQLDGKAGTASPTFTGTLTTANLTATGTTTLAGASTSADITFGDNDKAIFGAGSDLSIYHDGSDSFITDTGAGNLQIWGGNFRLRSSDGSEAVIDGNSGGAVTLYHDNAPKLATTSTGVDITGTLTSDGLTVDGDATIRDDAVTTSYYSTDVASNVVTHTSNGTGAFAQEVWRLNDGGTPSERMRLTTTGLGIGTSSPEGDGLHVQGSDNNNDDDLISLGFTFDANSKVLGTIGVHNSASNTGGLKFSTKNAGILEERMRIDASGNLLVGKATTAFGTQGVRLSSVGTVIATSNGNAPAELNRLTSDGTILGLYKDGAPVGSIGSVAGAYMALGKGNTGLLFQDGLNEITPYDISAGANEDAAINLGKSNARFKDLYLSGGVYLGGTGAANKLEDYETGYFEPNIQPTSGSITWNSAYDKLSYTKIGRLVHITGQLVVSSVSSPSGITRGSLPFTQLSQDEEAERTTGIALIKGTTLNGYEFAMYPNGGSDTFLEIVRVDTDIRRDAGSYFNSSTSIYISYTYVAA